MPLNILAKADRLKANYGTGERFGRQFSRGCMVSALEAMPYGKRCRLPAPSSSDSFRPPFGVVA